MEVLTKTRKAMSQDAIEQEIDIGINRATIYRVLNRFYDDGVLHKIVAEDGKQYFARYNKVGEQEIAKNHLHFKCLICETIECLHAEVNFSIPKAYIVQNVNCVLTGTCETVLNVGLAKNKGFPSNNTLPHKKTAH